MGLSALPEASTSSADAYATLKRAITEAGVLAPGQRLVERQLAAELGVSRTPVREALTLLEAEGLVRRTTRGLVVTSFDEASVRDTFEMRLLLESFAAERAAERARESDISELDRLVETGIVLAGRVQGASHKTNVLPQLVDLNGRFHRAILVASHNLRIVQAGILALEVPLTFKAFFWMNLDAIAGSFQAHADIAAAIRDRQPATARRLMEAHIRRGHHYVSESLRAPDARPIKPGPAR